MDVVWGNMTRGLELYLLMVSYVQYWLSGGSRKRNLGIGLVEIAHTPQARSPTRNAIFHPRL